MTHFFTLIYAQFFTYIAVTYEIFLLILIKQVTEIFLYILVCKIETMTLEK